MKSLRKLLFWTHLCAGVIAGVIILIMSLTGALIAFESQILQFAEKDLRTVPPPPPAPNASRLGPQEILAKVQAAKPKAKPSGLTLPAAANATAVVALGREGMVYVNPYTGELLGEGSQARAVFHFLTDWHRFLGREGESRAIGKAITGACNLAFLVLAVTGIFIWWPKKLTGQYLRPVAIFNLRLKGKARDFNWHNVTGIWTVVILLPIIVSGVVMSYQWANNLVYQLTGSQPPAAPGAGGPQAANQGAQQARGNKPAAPQSNEPIIPENLNQLWQQAEQQANRQANGWRSINLRFANRANAPASFTIEETAYTNPFARSQLQLNSTTGEVMKWESYGSASLGRRTRTWLRYIHTGEAAGIIGQLIAFIVSLGGALLVITGLLLAWRRFRNWQARRSKTNPQTDTVKDESEVKEPVTIS